MKKRGEIVKPDSGRHHETDDGKVGDGTRFLINQQISLGWKSNA